jgi:tetratricopeptide (TPR) repeat protein
LAAAALSASALAGSTSQEQIAQAREALRRGDGIAAEIALKRALDAGARREEVAAAMGEAWLDQGDLRRAREWLGSANFAAGTELQGFRMLGRLERLAGNPGAAGAAYNRALAITRDDATLWIDIAHLRYAGGEHLQGIEAADKALSLDPGHVDALLLRGQTVRDAFGPAAALPWFEAALAAAPGRIDLLSEYAATLGEADRASEMLVVVRRIHEIDPANGRGYFLQAVLAARAGNYGLARGILNRIRGPLRNEAATQLLQGALELEAGNTALAIDIFDHLAHRQPANQRVRHLLVRALSEAGEYKIVVKRFGPLAARRDASAYLMTLVARAHEQLGQRDLAAPLLDRAAAEPVGQLVLADESIDGVVPGGNSPGAQMRGLLGSGQIGAALGFGDRLLSGNPGSGDFLALSGDALAAAGRPADAVIRYRDAARVRLNDDLLLRMLVALAQTRQPGQQNMLVAQFSAGNPASRLALRMQATEAARRGDWALSRQLLENLIVRGQDRDVRLLCDLAFAQLQGGDKTAAVETSAKAYRLQPASLVATQAYAISLVAAGQQPKVARSLLEKARRIGGDNPLLVKARKQLPKR